MKKKTVDVIIPTYNGLPYLKETVQSVLDQTYKELRLYIIDDGSTDKTEVYAKSLKDPRVVYHKKANGGQAESRNLGIKISSSHYVALLDADDVWYPEKLAKQVTVLERDPEIGMVYGLHKLIDDDGKEIGEVTYSKSGRIFHYLLGGNRISGSASMVLVRRSVFDEVGLFHEDFLIGEDWEMWLRIAYQYKIQCIDEFLAALRVRQGGMQQNYLKMAKGLDYMLPIMLKEFDLSPRGKARLKGVCLFESAHFYYMAGEIEAARKNFRKLVRINPLRIERNPKYRYMYMRLFFGGPWQRNIRHHAKKIIKPKRNS